VFGRRTKVYGRTAALIGALALGMLLPPAQALGQKNIPFGSPGARPHAAGLRAAVAA
jgi:hypothetical protein